MSAFALVLVLASAFAHALWNLLAKRSADRLAFLWRMNVAIAVAGAPLVLGAVVAAPIPPLGWVYALGTGVLHVFYFWTLGRAYSFGDLSLVYPIARGTGPLLVALLAPVVFGEMPAPLGAVGIALVVLGVYASHLRGFDAAAPLRSAWREPGSRYALLTGLVVCCYTLWDRAGVGVVAPLVYGYFPFAVPALVWAPLMRGRRSPPEAAAGWGMPLLAGALAYGAYGLVLIAFTSSKVSYVAAAREVGIVFGAIMGAALLGEHNSRARLAGSALICAGVAAIALAR